MGVTVVAIEAVRPLLDAKQKPVVDPVTKWHALTGCPPCVALDKEAHELKKRLHEFPGVDDFVGLHQPIMGPKRHPRCPQALIDTKVGFYPSIFVVPTKQWKATEADLNAPLEFVMYNGKFDSASGTYVSVDKPLNAMAAIKFAQTVCFPSGDDDAAEYDASETETLPPLKRAKLSESRSAAASHPTKHAESTFRLKSKSGRVAKVLFS